MGEQLQLLVKTSDEEALKEAKLFGAQIVESAEPLVEVRTKKDEEAAVKLAAKHGAVFVKCDDWKIIPLENLIAACKGKAKLIAVVGSAEETRLALQTMEIGVDGVLLQTQSASEVKKTVAALQAMHMREKLELEEAEVITVKPLGLGARSCIDTCSMMEEGEGMLVGSGSAGMLLVQAEVEKNELAAPRPFRVNAGSVSLYVRGPGGKTKYIEELEAGASVLLVNRQGSTREAFVGRSKIEIRPLLLVEVRGKNRIAKAIVQNAETIRLVTAQGSKPVTSLKKGDKVLAHFEQGGRHFGTLVREETIIEK